MTVPKHIADEYEKKRKRAEAECVKRKREVYRKLPQLEKLEQQCIALAYQLATPGLDISDDEYAQNKALAEENMHLLNAEIRRTLTEAGYSKNYLDIKYDCPICEDTGYCGYPVRHMCKCMQQRILEDMYASSNIDACQTFENCNFDVFRDPMHQKSMRKLFAELRKYADALPNVMPCNVLLIGATGLGKTYALNCVAHDAIEKGLSVVKITAYNIINATLRSINEGAATPDFINCDLLFIDDLGTEPMINNITEETLLTIINERETQGKATVIATNFSPKVLMERYDDRIYSRLFATMYTKAYSITGKDVRINI